MKKGIVIWICIILAVVILTVPDSVFNFNCSVSHKFERTSCYEFTCNRCGLKEESTYHIGWCSSMEKCPTCGTSAAEIGYTHHEMAYFEYEGTCKRAWYCTNCGIVSGDPYYNHSYEYVATKKCTRIRVCTKCGETDDTSFPVEYHDWGEGNCEKGLFCVNCGTQGPNRHKEGPTLFHGLSQCTRCDTLYASVDKTNMRFIVIQVLAVALTAFAFQYAIRRRKYMKINWWLILRTWLNDTIMTGDFRPAVLLKKTLKN